MERQLSTPRKQVSDQPANTLLFVDNDDRFAKSVTETIREKKTEKSVHFANEDDMVSSSEVSAADSLQTSRELISWIPSEHLYSEDTFIPETHGETSTAHSGPAASDPTAPSAVSYGSSTFIELESEDETKTESEYSSYTESISSSDVFSSRSGSATYREWKDVTEIVKDIEELEESEFVTQADVNYFARAQDDDTDFTDSMDEEMMEQARQDFLLATMRRLRLGSVYSPRSLALDSTSTTHRSGAKATVGENNKDQMSFCQKMIQRCKAETESKPTSASTRTTELHTKAESAKHQVLEHYGVSSALVDRLRVDNLCQRLDKKAKTLDEEAEKSVRFVKDHQDVEAEMAKQKFISQIQARVQNEKTEERIQAHLIRMHPVKWFSDFVIGLPGWDEDSREILYKYKRQVEKRMEETAE
ncbi:uncharacterized protein LOC101853933 [Aplysia californica]|uniref:Uncharacterized protein LOC101853933 n=1 Tax=Aplysia californica TaxID=6500 RepID=A0ABM0ZZ21_APLCA|nr:uncharacterized protein LOC101853933 [Aplysia californica]XP_005097531.1 uncharacterized protein LOC101853933 [Aplysia californica]XP_012937470.1 uncharacterized protein LOC101853933 [Aplysia californica]